MPKKPMHGDILVGPRYRAKDVRVGAGATVVLEKGRGYNNGTFELSYDPRAIIEVPEPIAGAIWRRGYGTAYFCWCERCRRITRTYKRKNEPQLRRWAANHRCGVANAPGDNDYLKTRPVGWTALGPVYGRR